MSINKGAKIDGDPAGNKIEQEVKDLESAVFETKSKSQAKKVEAPALSAPVVPATPAVAADQAEMLTQLLLLMAKREARLNQQEEEAEGRREAKRKQYANQRNEDEKVSLIAQANCKHQKGGRTRKANAVDDFNLSFFVYIGGEAVIKCLSCGMKWRITDTKEYVVRNGKVYKNHTRIGWEEALAMFGKTSNTLANSEIPGPMMKNVKVSLKNPSASTAAADIDLTPVGVIES